MNYLIDEQLCDELKIALDTQDKPKVYKVLKEIHDRIDGKCFCAAHSESDCLCGAWEGIWDD